MTLDAALLAALRESPVHLPGGELAALLHTEPANIAARVAGLSAAGFEIEDRPGLGYRLVAAPDRLIADDLWARLGRTSFIREILVFEETDSTNQRAIDLGENGALSGLVVFAERQTKGRGRFGRRWESAGQLGLWFSLLLRPAIPLSAWSRLTTWAAVTVAQAMEQAGGVDVRVKWPNDIEIGGRKVAGILIETMPDRAGAHFAVVGIGVNVNHTLEDFPEELRGRASSLRLASQRVIDRSALAAQILQVMASRAEGWNDREFPSLLAVAERRSSLLGRKVALEAAGSRIEGVAEGLAEDGRLLLRLESGALELIGSGEATVLANR